MDSGLVGSGYADHLTDADLAFLAGLTQGVAGPERVAAAAARLRGRPVDLPGLIADPRVFRAMFGPADPAAGRRGAVTAHERLAAARQGLAASATLASPFLIFAVAVHRAAAELQAMDHVPERSGRRQRVPLFDAPQLRDFVNSAARRLFLAELLGSFTRSSGATQRAPAPPGARPSRGARGPRRVSELDLTRTAALLDGVPEAERVGTYRRLGDVALFLTGVFPDYAAARAFGPAGAARLLGTAGVPAREHDQLAAAPAIELLEYLGAQWYRAAWELAPARTARLDVVAEVADRFRQARRVLNHIADRCLFPLGTPGLPRPPRDAAHEREVSRWPTAPGSARRSCSCRTWTGQWTSTSAC